MLAGEVLFAEVLTTPTGVSKGCGCVIWISGLQSYSDIYVVLSNSRHMRMPRVPFESCQKCRFSEGPFSSAKYVKLVLKDHRDLHTLRKDRENEARFGSSGGKRDFKPVWARP